MSARKALETLRQHITALILDDDAADIFLLEKQLGELTSYNVTVTTAHQVDDAERLFRTCDFDVIFADFWLSGHSSLDFISNTGGRAAGTPVVIVSGYDRSEVRLSGFKAGASAYLSKEGITPQAIEAALETACFSSRTENKLHTSLARTLTDADVTRGNLLDLSNMVRMLVDQMGDRAVSDLSDEQFTQIRNDLLECCEYFEKSERQKQTG